ncbi:MAG: hypothetical protein ACTS8S_00945 [Giesbergeria sp.]
MSKNITVREPVSRYLDSSGTGHDIAEDAIGADITEVCKAMLDRPWPSGPTYALLVSRMRDLVTEYELALQARKNEKV